MLLIPGVSVPARTHRKRGRSRVITLMEEERHWQALLRIHPGLLSGAGGTAEDSPVPCPASLQLPARTAFLSTALPPPLTPQDQKLLAVAKGLFSQAPFPTTAL